MISTIKSVNSYISSNECTALNVEGYESVKEVFGSGGTIKSNKGDPELIIYVKFKEKVNISGILIESSMDTEKRPAIVKIYANKTSLDFADVETEPATEVININSSNIGKSIGLKIAKFRNISTLYLYFSNPDADQIQVNNIQFAGTESENMDFSQIKNVNP